MPAFFIFLLSRIEPRGYGRRTSLMLGGHRPESSAAIGGWPPVEAKRVRFFLSSTKNNKRVDREVSPFCLWYSRDRTQGVWGKNFTKD